MFVVSYGNPFDGLGFYGPFEDVEDANSWAETELAREEDPWWVMELQAPGRKHWTRYTPRRGAPTIVVGGTVTEGLTLYGPFPGPAEAREWSLAKLKPVGNIVETLETP